MKYKKCNKQELAKFANDRQLIVCGKTSAGPTKRNYINALWEADKNVAFRFVDMPPEMSNAVYEELLTLKDSYTCHPQILAASTQTRGEGTSLLYCNNLIEIKISDEIRVHGVRCGRYEHPKGYDVMVLDWPEFLRRVKWLKVDFVPRKYPGPARHQVLYCRNLQKVLYSLCSFLKLDHKLASFEIDLQLLMISQATGTDDFLYPLQMLGRLPRLAIVGLDDVKVQSIRAANESAKHTGNVLKTWRPALEQVKVYKRIIEKTGLRHPDIFYGAQGIPRPPFYTADAFQRCYEQALQSLTAPYIFDAAWERTFHARMVRLSGYLDKIETKEVGRGIQKQVEELQALRSDFDSAVADRKSRNA